MTAPAFHLGSVPHMRARRGGLRPGGRGRPPGHRAMGGRRVRAVPGQHAGRVLEPGPVRPDGREQQPVRTTGRLGRARRARRAVHAPGRRARQPRPVPTGVRSRRDRARRAPRRGDLPPVPRRGRDLAPVHVGRHARRVPGDPRRAVPAAPERSLVLREAAPARARARRTFRPPGDRPSGGRAARRQTTSGICLPGYTDGAKSHVSIA